MDVIIWIRNFMISVSNIIHFASALISLLLNNHNTFTFHRRRRMTCMFCDLTLNSKFLLHFAFSLRFLCVAMNLCEWAIVCDWGPFFMRQMVVKLHTDFPCTWHNLRISGSLSVCTEFFSWYLEKNLEDMLNAYAVQCGYRKCDGIFCFDCVCV